MQMKAREHLLKCLKENGGRLSNARAHEALNSSLEKEISKDEYEEIKEQLISLGLAEKARGKGGSITLPVSLENPGNEDESQKDSVMHNLLISIRRTPGAFAKLNRSTITCLLSSSKDKLYAGYDPNEQRFHITYRVEKGNTDHTELVCRIFEAASKDMSASLSTGKHYTRLLLHRTLKYNTGLCYTEH